MKRTILAAGLTCTCAALFGCATPYQSTGYTGGYSETQLSPNVFKVYFRGNGFTNSERVSAVTVSDGAVFTIGDGR